MNKALIYLALTLTAFTNSAFTQQHHNLFFLHHVPQATFVNPANHHECKFYLGLPALSGVHFNLGHNGFTFNHLLNENPDSLYTFDGSTIHQKLARRNYLMSELYLNLLAIGLRINRNYYTFTIRERNDVALFYTEELFSLAYKGNTQFVGEWVELNSNGFLFNHFREYALGVSQQVNNETFYGIRGKLLFGKLNAQSTQSNFSFLTEENTYNLNFESDARIDASLPFSVQQNANGNLSLVQSDYSLLGLLFNRKNWGIATDIGFIAQLNEATTLSGSLLDLGFMLYRSNLTNLLLSGEIRYEGPLGDTIVTESYLRELTERITSTMDFTIGNSNFASFLPARFYFGVSHRITEKFSINALAAARLYKQKVPAGGSLTAVYRPFPFLSGSVNWNYLHRSVNNLGAGLVLGRSPLQLYIVSDNVVGFIWPRSTRNLNIAAGLNIITGCSARRVSSRVIGHGCQWLKDEEARKARKLKQLKQKF